MFINAKDGPFAAVMALALLGIVRAFEEYPRATPATVALCGIGVGLAIGTRVLGGFAVVDVLLALMFIIFMRSRESALKPALGECGSFLTAFIPGAILAYLVMGLVWPWSVLAPLNPFRAAAYFSHDFEKPWRELFDGRLIPVTQMPRSYVPTLIALKLPELMLALGICGTVAGIVAVGRRDCGTLGRRAGLLTILLAAMLPVLVTIAARPYLYNGIRHLRVRDAAVRRARRPRRRLDRAAAATVRHHRRGRRQPRMRCRHCLPESSIWCGCILTSIRITIISPAAFAARKSNFMLDYWGLSLTQASRQLLAHVADSHQTPPNGHWTVAVCGPHPPVTVALGPLFTTTWDPKGADFAMQLGVFYCAKLDAPPLFEIVRDGVVYARVYDIRGRSISSLLTVPGIDKTHY